MSTHIYNVCEDHILKNMVLTGWRPMGIVTHVNKERNENLAQP
jgi:hypothetical protein